MSSSGGPPGRVLVFPQPVRAFEIAGSHAVVTGGGRGIGLAIARALVRAGARVSIVSRTPERERGDDAFFRASANVGINAQVAVAFNSCRAAHGPISILVNNAGIAASAPLLRTNLGMWKRMLGTNLTGTFLCTRAALPDMLAAKSGRILNVASTAGLSGGAYISAYCASKHGVVGFTRAIAAELHSKGITANALCPGYAETEMLDLAIANIVERTGATVDAARARLASENPLGRIAELDEIAAAAIDLIASDRTGVATVVPGGATY